MRRRNFSREFKLTVLREIDGGKGAAQISREHNIHPTMVSKWKRIYKENPERAFSGNGNAYTLEAKLAESQRLIGKLYAENEFLKKVLAILEARRAEARKQEGRIGCTTS